MVNMNKLKDPAVYALLAGDGQIRYVGSTSQNATTRLWEHISRARAGHPSPVYQWMRSVPLESISVVVVAREHDPSTREALEASVIKQFLDEGHPLVNRLSRDGRLNSMAPESRALIGAKAKGRDTWTKGKRGEAAGWTPERRARQSERMRNRAA